MLQVTTLLSRHDKALSEPATSQQQLQQLQQQVSDQGSAVKQAKAVAKEAGSEEAKAQVSPCYCACNYHGTCGARQLPTTLKDLEATPLISSSMPLQQA